MEYLVGQHVQTPLGSGTITGFETFIVGGFEGPVACRDNGRRAIVRMDDPKSWKPTLLTPHPYMFRSDLTAI